MGKDDVVWLLVLKRDAKDKEPEAKEKPTEDKAIEAIKKLGDEPEAALSPQRQMTFLMACTNWSKPARSSSSPRIRRSSGRTQTP